MSLLRDVLKAILEEWRAHKAPATPLCEAQGRERLGYTEEPGP